MADSAPPICVGHIARGDLAGCGAQAEAVVVGVVPVDRGRVAMGAAVVCARHVAAMRAFLSAPGEAAVVLPVAALDDVRAQLGGELLEMAAGDRRV